MQAAEAPASGDTGTAEERVVALQREVRSLRLDLAERDQRLAVLTADLERERRQAERRSQEAAGAQVTALLTAAAPAAAQLQAQAQLLAARQPVQATDVLAVGRRLVAALEDAGLQLDDDLGQRVAYDPNLHQALVAGAVLAPGEPVLVRLPVVRLAGRVLCRGMVEATTD